MKISTSFYITAVSAFMLMAAGDAIAGVGSLTPRRVAASQVEKSQQVAGPKNVKARIVENGWHSVGTGRWYEGLLTIFDEIDYDLNWDIEVEESDEVEGYYRFIPYHEGSPIAEIIGAADHEYFYLDATDPDRVICEDFIAYRDFEYNYYFSQLVEENGFWDIDMGGVLEDNVVYFPRKSFGWWADEIGSFMAVNAEGDFKIVLPGGEARPNWNTLGESTFVDGFCGPYFKGEAISTTVTVEERDRRPGYFRLKGAFSQYGSDNPLIIDATDPDFVILPYQETGFEHDVRGTVVVYSHCENFISPAKYPTYSDYAEAYPQYVATYKDGAIVFPPDACVLHFPDWDPWIFTTNDDEACESSVVIPTSQSGIKEIGDDIPAVDLPVEYYNIMGQRVNNPGPGLYIMRQGNQSRKIFVR